MDSITHGLSIATLLIMTGAMEFLPFGVLGAIIPDIDVIFTPLSSTYPSLFIFSHGGVTHSTMGALITSLLSFLGMWYIARFPSVQERYLARVPILRDQLPLHSNFLAFLVVEAGAFLHLGLDALTFPGIPLLYPFSVKKYTLGLFPGPSILFMVASICFLGFLIYGKVTLADLRLYAALLLIVLVVHGGMKVYVNANNEGTAIPMLNPLSWLIIDERNTSFAVDEYDVFRGSRQNTPLTDTEILLPWRASNGRPCH